MFGTVYLFFLCTYLLQWVTENTDSFLKSWQDGLHGLSHISRDYTSLEQRSEIPHGSIPETGFDWSFLSKLWCLLSISSIFAPVSQAERVFSSPLPSTNRVSIPSCREPSSGIPRERRTTTHPWMLFHYTWHSVTEEALKHLVTDTD